MNTYIGIGIKGSGNIGPANDVMIIKNRDDFLNGSFDDLVLLNKAGIMSPEVSTLNMIDKARSKFEEALKRIASVSSPQPQSQQQPK